MARERKKKAACQADSHTYRYLAKTSDGKTVTGTSEAESAEVLASRLREKGYFVQKIEGPVSEPRRPLTDEEQEEPIRRIAGVILEQAVKDKAQFIRLEQEEAEEPRTMVVRYLVAGAWREVMSVPMYVWEPMRRHLAKRAGLTLRDDDCPQRGTIHFSTAEKEHEARIAFQQRVIEIDLSPGRRGGS